MSADRKFVCVAVVFAVTAEVSWPLELDRLPFDVPEAAPNPPLAPPPRPFAPVAAPPVPDPVVPPPSPSPPVAGPPIPNPANAGPPVPVAPLASQEPSWVTVSPAVEVTVAPVAKLDGSNVMVGVLLMSPLLVPVPPLPAD